MNRQVLASEALQLSRSILSEVPVGARIASLAHGFLRRAFTRDDMHLAIGLHALIAMEKAGTPGRVGDSTIEELRPWIKRNVLSKLKSVALKVGAQIYNLSMAGKRGISLPVVEEAWENTTHLIERHPIDPGKNVGEVIAFIARGFTMRIQDVLKNRKRRQEIEQGAEFQQDTSRDEESSDVADWKRIEHRFKSDPLLLGPKGEPWAWIYIEGKAGGMSETSIIAQWNEVSRRSGGAGDMDRPSFLGWLRQVDRARLMKELAREYLDDDTVARLKLAVSRGALKTAMLQPFEYELLELLAA